MNKEKQDLLGLFAYIREKCDMILMYNEKDQFAPRITNAINEYIKNLVRKQEEKIKQ